MKDRSSPSRQLVSDEAILMARTSGVGSGMRVKATAVEVKTASPTGAVKSLTAVRIKAFGGSVGDWCQVRKVFESGPIKDRKRSKKYCIAAKEPLRF